MMTTDLLADFSHVVWNEAAAPLKKDEAAKMRMPIDILEMHQQCKLSSLVRSEDYEGIERLLYYGVEDLVNYVHPFDSLGTALSIAADLNNENMISFLLSKGANPNVVDMCSRTAASRACEYGHVEALKVLIEAGTDVTITDEDGNCILFYCIGPSNRHVLCAEKCIKTGALVNVVNKFGMPLIVAHCENASNNEEICILLIQNGADSDVMDMSTRRTALMAAAGNGSLKVVKAILENGCSNINERMINTNSHVTHDAARSGSLDIMKLLSAYGADFDQKTSHAYCRALTPMHIAALNDQPLCCLFAGQRGTNATLKNREGFTPAMVAKKAGFKNAAKLCKRTEKFAPSKKKKKKRNPPLWLIKLHDAVYMREDRLLEEFEKYDPDMERLVNINQFLQVLEQLNVREPLEEKEAFMEIVAKHMEADDKVNYLKFILGKLYIPKKLMMSKFERKVKKLKAIKGKTKANIPICEMPEGHKAFEYVKVHSETYDPFRFDRDHPPENAFVNDSYWYMDRPEDRFITLTEAVIKADETTIDDAMNEGMAVDERSRYFKTPLMTAIMNSNMTLVKKFVEAGANVNQRDNFLWTPLHLACHVGSLEIVQYLLLRGAKPNNISINKALPIVRALEAKALEVVEALVAAKTTLDEPDRKGASLEELTALFADYYIFEFLKSQNLPDDKKKNKKKKKKATVTLPPMAFIEKVHPIMPPNPPTTDSILPSLHFPRMIETTSSQTYNDNLDENLIFRPHTVWIKQKTTEELISEKITRRNILGWNVDSDLYVSKVVENVEDKAQRLLNEMNMKVVRPITKIKMPKRAGMGGGNAKKGTKGKKK